jgi:ribose transport system ATP-binding protein
MERKEAMNTPVVTMKGISKRFPGVQALDHVDFEVYQGEVHALVGENGAGKSTLMKILSGIYAKDEGQIILDGQVVELRNPAEAQQHGIGVIYQEFDLAPNLTVTENIMLCREPASRLGWINQRECHRRAQEGLDALGIHIDLNAMVSQLKVGERQMVAIVKALSLNARIIVMDEPTSALGEHEIDLLFQIIKNLKSQNVSVVYISHRLEEIGRIADRVTVLRDGRLVGSIGVAEASTDQIVSMMVGRELKDFFRKEEATIGDVVLEVRQLGSEGVVHDVSFQLRRGEILGFAGLIGAKRTETARLIFGLDRKDRGEVLIDGAPVDIESPEDAIRLGVALVPEDRKGQGLLVRWPISENVTLPRLDHFSSYGLVDVREEEKQSNTYIKSLGVKTPSVRQPVMYLSGGNQQKVVIAKWLMTEPRVLILDEPTRGIDVGAKAEIYALMSQLAKRGIGILLISSELPEIVGMSDRIIVMREGRITGELSRAEATEEKIMRFATAALTS